MPDHHVKGQPAASTFVRKKGGITCDSNRGTPCIYECEMFLWCQISSCGHVISVHAAQPSTGNYRTEAEPGICTIL